MLGWWRTCPECVDGVSDYKIVPFRPIPWVIINTHAGDNPNILRWVYEFYRAMFTQRFTMGFDVTRKWKLAFEEEKRHNCGIPFNFFLFGLSILQWLRFSLSLRRHAPYYLLQTAFSHLFAVSLLNCVRCLFGSRLRNIPKALLTFPKFVESFRVCELRANAEVGFNGKRGRLPFRVFFF